MLARVRMPSVRSLSVALGFWLVASPFLWPHTFWQVMNGVVVGVLVAAVAMAAAHHPPVRYVNTALAVWLIVSAWWLPSFTFVSVLNRFAVGFVLLLLTLPATITTRRADAAR